MKKWSIFSSFILLLAGCSNITVLSPKSATGKEQADLIWFSLAIMTVVLVVVFVLFARFVSTYRYTKKRHNVVPQDVKGNLKLELTWTIIPLILLTMLAIPTVKTTLNQSPSAEAKTDPDSIHIHVTAEQFSWTFEHHNDKSITDELVIPAGEEIVLHLTSNDVIHSFWVPSLAGKVDVIPNQEIIYVIENAEIGEYAGKCAEYCGIQHANMVFDVHVVSKSEYEDYLKESDNKENEGNT